MTSSSNNNNNQFAFFSTEDYSIPQWSDEPKFTFYFEVIKDGCILSQVPIRKKPFHLIGRLQDLCDIHIDNPTVSRKHAILQFHNQQSEPYLYDLGNTHGTFVNREKLNPKVYKKLSPFMTVKFGVSSRQFILRCPALESIEQQKEEQKENQFIQAINLQNKQLSKEEAKQQYLKLLENDPIFGSDVKSRKFQGKNTKKSLSMTENNTEGISWGMTDQNEIYGHRNQKDYPIETDVIRRLPGLDSTTLEKLAQYEDKLRHYEEIENQLNQLANQEKRQYGLEEKQQDKKDKLQKRFVEALEALEKVQDWIRVTLFGDSQEQLNDKKKAKFKETDTFEDDDFYDRTLENKGKKDGEGEIRGGDTLFALKQSNFEDGKPATDEDLWALKQRFTEQLKKKRDLQELKGLSKQNVEGESASQDELDNFMKQNQTEYEEQNRKTTQREALQIERNLSNIRERLKIFLKDKQIDRLEASILSPENKIDEEDRKEKERLKQQQKLSQTLQRLQKQEERRLQKENLRQKVLDAEKELDEEDENVFERYKEIERLKRQYEGQNFSQEENSEEIYTNMRSQSDNNFLGIEGSKKIKLNEDFMNLQNNAENNLDAKEQTQKSVDLTSRFA